MDEGSRNESLDGESDLGVTVTIPVDLMGKATAIITRANARLVRAGVDERFELVVNRTELSQRYDPDTAAEYTVEVNHCTLSQPTIAAGGWEFVAKAEWDEDIDGVLLRVNPSAEDVESLAVPTELTCDHCRATRARRKCYVIRHLDTRETMLVGAQCVAPFLGLSVSALWWLDAPLDEAINDLGGEGLRSSMRAPRDAVIATAWAASAEGRAYVPSSGEHPTRNAVSAVLFPVFGRRESPREKAAREEITARAGEYEGDGELMEALRSSVDTLNAESPYGRTMQALVAAPFISPKNLGFLVSIAAVHRRNIDNTARKAAAVKEKSEIVGGLFADIKSTIEDVAVTVRSSHRYTNHFNDQLAAAVEMTTPSGHILKWMSGSDKALSLEVGDQLTIVRATVKGLDTYRDIDSTLIIRPKFA